MAGPGLNTPSALAVVGGDSSKASGLLDQLKGMLGGGEGGGGVGGLLEKLNVGGLGDKASSWIGTGDNAPVDGDEIEATVDRGRSRSQRLDGPVERVRVGKDGQRADPRQRRRGREPGQYPGDPLFGIGWRASRATSPTVFVGGGLLRSRTTVIADWFQATRARVR